MKIIQRVLILTAILTLTSCVTYRNQFGNTATLADTFDCDQKCGAYDVRASGIYIGWCTAKCMEAKGYRGGFK
jgi:hypothetical protein